MSQKNLSNSGSFTLVVWTLLSVVGRHGHLSSISSLNIKAHWVSPSAWVQLKAFYEHEDRLECDCVSHPGVHFTWCRLWCSAVEFLIVSWCHSVFLTAAVLMSDASVTFLSLSPPSSNHPFPKPYGLNCIILHRSNTQGFLQISLFYCFRPQDAGSQQIGFLLGSCGVTLALTTDACQKGLPKAQTGEVATFKGTVCLQPVKC